MSDTPRTAAAKIACGFQAVPESFLNHAEQLERENAALGASEHGCRQIIDTYVDEITDLEKENAALRADKERLDWCDKNLSGLTLLGKSMREYVDAARKEQS